MTGDPAGHYATLEVEPTAAPEAITAAYRRKARVLHPDVPQTGDAEAFIRLAAAYEILSDAGRRAAYDRAASAAALVPPAAPAAMEPAPRGPRLSDLPIGLWAGLGGLFCVAAVMAVVQFIGTASPPPSAIRPFAPPAAPAARLPPAQEFPTAVGPTTHYVLPAGTDTVLWRHDAVRDTYLPAGHIAAFSPVLVLRLVPQHGLVEIGMPDGGGGAFIDAARLTPGDRAAARRAYCAYNAGPSPRNGEVLARHGNGVTRLEIANHTAQAAVVKLRDASGQAVATVFVAPGDGTVVAGLPDVVYRPDFAVGELWSRAGYASPSGLSPLVIPPDLSVAPAPVDIPDAEFERE
jgi:DnaJ domain